jgi:hypothetical protein
MVVGRESGVGKRVGLILFEHAERAARLHAQCPNSTHHLEHTVELRPARHVPPGGAHAEARRTLLARRNRRT